MGSKTIYERSKDNNAINTTHFFSTNASKLNKSALSLMDIDATNTNQFKIQSQNVKDIRTKKLTDCSNRDIINALTNCIFDELKNKKINENKSELISYFQKNKIDGLLLTKMTRKEFGKAVVSHTNNKKLMGISIKLFDKLESYEYKISQTTKLEQIINEPKSTSTVTTTVTTTAVTTATISEQAKTATTHVTNCRHLLLKGEYNNVISLLKPLILQDLATTTEEEERSENDKLNEYRLIMSIALFYRDYDNDMTNALEFCNSIISNCSNNNQIQYYQARKIRGLIHKTLGNSQAACNDFEFIGYNNPYHKTWIDNLNLNISQQDALSKSEAIQTVDKQIDKKPQPQKKNQNAKKKRAKNNKDKYREDINTIPLNNDTVVIDSSSKAPSSLQHDHVHKEDKWITKTTKNNKKPKISVNNMENNNSSNNIIPKPSFFSLNINNRPSSNSNNNMSSFKEDDNTIFCRVFINKQSELTENINSSQDIWKLAELHQPQIDMESLREDIPHAFRKAKWIKPLFKNKKQYTWKIYTYDSCGADLEIEDDDDLQEEIN
eukprot:20812_1